jgi:hypothetical protein
MESRNAIHDTTYRPVDFIDYRKVDGPRPSAFKRLLRTGFGSLICAVHEVTRLLRSISLSNVIPNDRSLTFPPTANLDIDDIGVGVLQSRGEQT